MSKKRIVFPYILGTRLSAEDGEWVSKKAASLKIAESSLARILIGIGKEAVQQNPALFFSEA